MPTYAYKALTESGHPVSGVVEADSVDQANAKLLAMGYIPSKITRDTGVGAGFSLKPGRKVKVPDLVLFTKQFRTLFKAGVPIVSLLQILENQTPNEKLKKVCVEISKDIKQGLSLNEAFGRHKQVFSPLYVSMIYAGESSGSLPEVLDRLIYILSHEHKIKSDIKSAMVYPVIVLIALVGAFFVLLNFVVPVFARIFLSAGLDLPLPTRICIWLNAFMRGNWVILTLLSAMTVVGLIAYVKTENGRRRKDALKLKAPLLGPLYLKAAMSRFSSIFAILITSGVSILESLKILSGTLGNAAIAREFDRLRERLVEGRGIAKPLQTSKFFTPMVINMIAIGEESGNLDEMLRDISMHYDDEVEYAVERMAAAITPILTVGLAGIVLFFAMSIFLPLFDLTKMAQSGF